MRTRTAFQGTRKQTNKQTSHNIVLITSRLEMQSAKSNSFYSKWENPDICHVNEIFFGCIEIPNYCSFIYKTSIV